MSETKIPANDQAPERCPDCGAERCMWSGSECEFRCSSAMTYSEQVERTGEHTVGHVSRWRFTKHSVKCLSAALNACRETLASHRASASAAERFAGMVLAARNVRTMGPTMISEFAIECGLMQLIPVPDMETPDMVAPELTPAGLALVVAAKGEG